MKKKGFTLVELLAVIAMLAILVIIVLPNIMSLFNQAKQNSFENELKQIFKTAEQEWMKDSMFDTQSIVYARNKSAKCTKELSLSGREEIEYYIEVDKGGNIIKYFATDGSYQYEYNGTGLKIEEIGGSEQVANLENTDVLKVTCAGGTKGEEGTGGGETLVGTNKGQDCSNNDVYNTIPSNATGLYKIMAEQAYMDNAESMYVESCSGVDFSNISSYMNGTGVYEIASTKDDTYPIYYYRGEVNNNVKFAGFCWKAVRTTSTGGVKLIYNGRPDASGHCTNTKGDSTQIKESEFNYNDDYNYASPAYAGYMYGTTDGTSTGIPYMAAVKALSTSDAGIKFGKSVTHDGSKYKLTNTIVFDETNYNISEFKNNHYTCFSESDECSTVYYVFYVEGSSACFYITISGVNPNGKELIDVVKDNMFSNHRDSKAKIEIETWYENNMTSYTSKIEDTVYCNDRSITETSGWNPTGNMTDVLYFSGTTREYSTHKPSLVCERADDKFTVSASIGNGKLKYPVGLLTIDEIMLAGGAQPGSGRPDDHTYYLFTNERFWAGSPAYFSVDNAFVSEVDHIGYPGEDYVDYTKGLRPIISLSKNTSVSGGDGTSNNPYVVE